MVFNNFKKRGGFGSRTLNFISSGVVLAGSSASSPKLSPAVSYSNAVSNSGSAVVTIQLHAQQSECPGSVSGGHGPHPRKHAE